MSALPHLAWAGGFDAIAMADWLIFWTLRSAALLLLGLSVRRFLRQQPASLQHIWLLSLLAIPLALPVLDQAAGRIAPVESAALAIHWNPGQIATTWESEASAPFGPQDSNQPVTSGERRSSGPAFAKWLCILWIAGASFILLRMLMSQVYLQRLERRSHLTSTGPLQDALEMEMERQQIRRPVRLLLTPENLPPMTWGVWRCRIALPAEASDWAPARLETVLRHELAHVRRRDGWLLLGGQIVLALQWWNPLIWRTLRHLRETTEFLCDDFVLRSGGHSSDYAEMLLLSSGSRVPVLPAALSDGHGLKRRITRILDSSVPRRPASHRYSLLLIALLLVAAWPLAQLSGQTKEGIMEVDGRLVPTKIADGFDYPVGAPDAKGYYVFRGLVFGGMNHIGEDWNAASGKDDLGDPVFAIADGLVIDSKDYRAGWGHVIILRHRYRDLDGQIKVVDSLYAHLHDRKVQEGDLVRRGQEIGSIGNNRGMYAAHLHLELRQNLDIKVTNRNDFERNRKNWLSPRAFIRDRRPKSTAP